MILCLASAAPVAAQSVVGEWISIDDKTEKPRSVIEIWEAQGVVYGRIKALFPEPGEDPNPLCDECKGELKDQPVLGMRILWDMKPDGDKWSGGKIMDPENGKTYRCKLWVEDGTLKVRGYLAFFYRTQTWIPAESVPGLVPDGTKPLN